MHIRENVELNDSEKFCYLKSFVTEPDALVIEVLIKSQASYQDAIDILKAEPTKQNIQWTSVFIHFFHYQ